MKINRLNILLLLGLIAITGILVLQVLWVRQAFNVEEKKFSQKAHVVLLRTLERLYRMDDREMPLTNPISKISNDYYVVNVNNDFEPSVLEYCLKTEFENAGLLTDFEYAVYKCESDEMVYGNYISVGNARQKANSLHFPKQKGLVYYFAIRFPGQSSYLLGNLAFWLSMSCILVLVLVIYLYSLFTIFRQKKYYELQRDFINNMTHEFKTPLSSILIASTYLNKQEQIRADKKLGTYTSIIIDQSKKLNNHIEKVLNIARWENTPMKLEATSIHVVTLLNQIIENMKLKHEELQVEIRPGESDIFIMADEFHFSNLIYNLIDNSIKYCDVTPRIIISLKETGGKVMMEFTDNGIGIPNKEISFVFDKFYRSQGSRSNEVNGFGLGLYYVRKICVLHKWRIFASNNHDSGGLTVSLEIPGT